MVCYNMKVKNIYTYDFHQNQNNFNKDYIKVVRNLYALTQKNNEQTDTKCLSEC